MIQKFLVLLCLIVCGCENNHSSRAWIKDSSKIKVLSTISQIHDLVEEIGGERVEARVLIPQAMDPHNYELAKGDCDRMEQADLIFYNGLDLEHGASISAYLHQSPKATALGEWIRQQYPQQLLYHGIVVDPHIWMDVSLWEKIVFCIADHLIAIDPQGANGYRQRAQNLSRRMMGVHQQIKDILQSVPLDRRYLVTSHDSFEYFGKSYLSENGESRFAAPEGLAPDGQMGPADIRRIIDFLHTHMLHVIFAESNVSRDGLTKIANAAKEMGLDVNICPAPLYSDAMQSGGYLKTMIYNAQTIAQHAGN